MTTGPVWAAQTPVATEVLEGGRSFFNCPTHLVPVEKHMLEVYSRIRGEEEGCLPIKARQTGRELLEVFK